MGVLLFLLLQLKNTKIMQFEGCHLEKFFPLATYLKAE